MEESKRLFYIWLDSIRIQRQNNSLKAFIDYIKTLHIVGYGFLDNKNYFCINFKKANFAISYITNYSQKCSEIVKVLTDKTILIMAETQAVNMNFINPDKVNSELDAYEFYLDQAKHNFGERMVQNDI